MASYEETLALPFSEREIGLLYPKSTMLKFDSEEIGVFIIHPVVDGFTIIFHPSSAFSPSKDYVKNLGTVAEYDLAAAVAKAYLTKLKAHL